MLKKLTEYYQHKGIYPLDFRCQHWQACSEGNPNITQAKGAFVGTKYERGLLPRLLFLSLDPGESDSDPIKRTVERVRYSEENECNVANLLKGKRKHWHWYRTHELALTLLKKNFEKFFQREMQIQDTHFYFAHANSLKCSMNNKDHKQASPKLFKNCREYIGGELAILNPDILVTQGNEAKNAIEQTFEVFHLVEGDIYSKCIRINGKRTLWFHTYHPSNYGSFNKQRRECFKKWAKYVYKRFSQNDQVPNH